MYVEKQPAVTGHVDSAVNYAPSTLADIYPLLCEADWSLAVLGKWLPAIAEQAHTLDPAQRTDWLLGLRSAWQHHGWAFTQRDRERLFEVAGRWGDWRLLLSIAEAIAGQRSLDTCETLQCIDALWQLGDTEQARQSARRLCLSDPACGDAANRYGDLQAWAAWLARHPFGATLTAADDGLYLEPLGHHHISAFARQYYDPAIAQLCCLPQFDSDEQWHRWVDEVASYGDQLVFSVLHEEWGFVGSVSLVLHEGVGFFYYWIGPDFQGHGLGPKAVNLMLALARESCGMHTCYAKVFEYNRASQRGLEKLGFERLMVSALPPHDDELFYRYGHPAGHDEAVRELKQLTKLMGSDIAIASFDVRVARS